MEHNINQAKAFLTLLTGEVDPVVTWQSFYDPKNEAKKPELATYFTSTLTEALPRIKWQQERFCGIYIGLNVTDGKGRKNENVVRYRAVFADFDGMEEPEWALMPHFVQKRDVTHGHAFWLVSDITTANQYKALQKRIALYQGTDKTVCDPARVVRVAGFNHYKNPLIPEQYAIIEDNTDGDFKYTMEDIINAFQLTPKQDAELNSWFEKNTQSTEVIPFENNEFYINKFTNWLKKTAPPAILGNGSHTLYKVASYAYDIALPLETTQELMWHHYNQRCVPIWGEHERDNFNEPIKNAYKYSTSAAGCKTAVAGFSSLPPLIEPIGGWEANAKLRLKPVSESNHISSVYCGEIDYLSPLPNLKKNNIKPIRTHENLTEICARLKVIVRYNVIAKKEEIIIPNMGFSKDNEANASLSWLKSESAKFDYNPDWVDGFITYLAEYNKYNPVRNWIDSKDWDGEDRLSLLLDTVVSHGDNEFKNTLITRWLISAVSAAYSIDGITAQGILVFQGEQSLGKTRWFNNLVPKEFNLTKDGFLLRPDDKDSVKQACSFWLVELGEIDSTFRKSDIAALKAFVTTAMDVFRNPYAKKESRYARRTVFFGSVNPSGFLADETGNRRFWTIACQSIEHSHNIDMQQVWAQVKSLMDNGASYYLTEQELSLLNEQNEDHSSGSPIADLIFSHLNWDAPKDKWVMLTATHILKMVGIIKPNRRETTEVSSLIKKHNGNNIKRTGKGRLLLTPPLKVNVCLPVMTM